MPKIPNDFIGITPLVVFFCMPEVPDRLVSIFQIRYRASLVATQKFTWSI